MEVSELQSSINALRRQNWSQLPDRAPLDLVDPVVVPAAIIAAAPAAAGGAAAAAAGSRASSATTSSASTPSPAVRTSGTVAGAR